MEIDRQSIPGETLQTQKLEQFIKSFPLLTKAYDLAQKAHEGQLRAEGTPYFTHCVAVARILYEEWGITDPEIIAAGLLHDTVEDNKNITLADIARDFGPKIAFWVDGVSQFRSKKEEISGKSKKQNDRETVRKVFSKNLIDPTVGVLKLADRLHNMRTLEFMPIKNQIAKADETKDYAKLAESLGMWKVKTELENLSFRYTDPEGYKEYAEILQRDGRIDKKFIDYTTSTLDMIIAKTCVNATIEPQINSLSRLKDKSGEKPFSDINDVISFRVSVKNMESEDDTLYECYKLLGAIQKHYKGVEDPSRFDNFYLEPKDNGYSAIQVTLKTPYGAVEIVITSEDKEEFNNWGVVSLIKSNKKDLQNHALKLIFTPTGDVKFFDPNDTGVDYAYSISAEMGAQATGISINGEEEKSISTVIPNGAQVEVELGKSRIAPEPNIINFASPRTRRIIESQFLELEMAEQEKKGKEMVTAVIAERGLLNLYDLLRIDEYSKKMVDILFLLGSKNSLPKLYRRVANGLVTIEMLKKQLDDFGITKEKMGLTSILIEGPDNLGLLNSFASDVEKLGGNIRRNRGESNKQTFTQLLVVENLSKKSEEILAQKFQNDSQIKRVVIV